MAGFRLKVEGLRSLSRKVGMAHRGLTREMRQRVPQVTSMILSAIRRGNFFDRPTGRLQRTMRPGRVYSDLRGVGQTIDWGVPYGRVLEFGPRVRRWVIAARRAQFLRFVSGGRVVFARRVVRRWDRSQLRPHVGPTIDRLRPLIVRELGKPPRVLFRRFR